MFRVCTQASVPDFILNNFFGPVCSMRAWDSVTILALLLTSTEASRVLVNPSVVIPGSPVPR